MVDWTKDNCWVTSAEAEFWLWTRVKVTRMPEKQTDGDGEDGEID